MLQNARYIDLHNHTKYSNIRLIDSINQVEGLVKRAVSLGMKGIAITDHECLSASMEVCRVQDKYPDFKIAIGNEIYLTNTRDTKQKFFHFILVAKDAIGHKQLRILSSESWMQSFKVGKMERVPTLKAELAAVIKKDPGHLIATTACIGGELSQLVLQLDMYRQIGERQKANETYEEIINFITACKSLFGDDFYIELPPGASEEQVIVNKKLYAIAKALDVKFLINCDSHYLTKEDRAIHKNFLNSKNGEREVDAFYEYAYLQDDEDIIKHMAAAFGDEAEQIVDEAYANSQEVWNKIQVYDLRHKQHIPTVDIPQIQKQRPPQEFKEKYPVLSSLYESDNNYDRYWVNKCIDKLKEINKYEPTYISRLEEEADIKKTISDKLETNMFSYPITLSHYIDKIWEAGSLVGAGRGSSCSGLNHYLLGVTQLDPIEWGLPFWRYLNKERAELGDIDIDISPSQRPKVISEICKDRAKNFKADISPIARKYFGATLVATFGTASTKRAIQIACSGYRSEQYPKGIDIDVAQYISSLVPQERGFVYSMQDLVYGNEEKGRKPNTTFLAEVNKYPGLLDIMLGVSGLVVSRGSHASGVIFFDEDPYEYACFMRTPRGDVITQYELHDAEAAGMTKYDFLVTDVQDKLLETIKLLQKYNELPKTLSIREIYNKYFHPNVMPLDEKDVWDNIKNGKIINMFQFEGDVGAAALKKIQPQTIIELTDVNGEMRLMTAEKGEETPLDKYARFRNNISLWYDEMRRYNLSDKEVKVIEPYFLKSYGVPPSQEQLMQMLMDPEICNFSLADANKARKIVGKKQMDKIPDLREKVLKSAKSSALGNYIWKFGIGPQMGYAFSVIHSLAYSIIGYQTAYIATKWNPIYWNCACLIVNSASIEEEPIEDADLIDDSNNDDDEEETEKKSSNTNYEKIAKAIGIIQQQGVSVSLLDINKSSYTFEPDIENNTIMYGFKPLTNVNDEVIEQIYKNRPYVSIKDFMNKVKLKKPAMVALIKGGAFDNIDKEWAAEVGVDTRKASMAYYISKICEPKTRLNLQNFNALIEKNLLPDDMDIYKALYKFNKARCNREEIVLNETIVSELNEYLDFEDLIDELKILDFNYNANIKLYTISKKSWKKIYDKLMDVPREYLKNNQQDMLRRYNSILFKECWEKYALGNLSKWEMDSLCFYYHEHELSHVDKDMFGIKEFKMLPEDPVPARYFRRNGRDIPLWQLSVIIGTVIGKNDSKSTISLLTTTGVISVKFTKDFYAMFKRQISQLQEDGKKKVIEQGWFKRGTKLMITGYRRGDMFIGKTYADTPTHQLYKINDITSDGELILQNERAKTE